MSETKSKSKSKWKRLPKISVLRVMEQSNPEMRERFEQWVEDLPNFGEGPAYWLGVSHPFEVHAEKWKISDYDKTWAQIVAVCRANPENIAIIVSEIFPTFTVEAVARAKLVFRAEMANARRRELVLALGPQPVEINDMSQEHHLVLLNSSIRSLDAMRHYDTAAEQAEALEHSVDAAAYVVAFAPGLLPDDAPRWVWVRGRDRAVARGVANCPPEAGTHVFDLPDQFMLQAVLIAFGDCLAAGNLMMEFSDDDFEHVGGFCRHLATLSSLTERYGVQPTWPDCRFD